MSYPHKVSITVPAAMAADANQLALVIGEQPDDDTTFTGPTNALIAGDPPVPAYFVGTRVVASLASDIATMTLEKPSYAPDTDLVSAEAARSALSWSGPASATTISIRIDMDHAAAMQDMGVTLAGDE